MEENYNPLLKSFIPLVEALGKMFGKNCEVVLHDISNPQKSIVAIANGHVTGRKVGGPMTDYGLMVLREGKYEDVINYRSKSKDGKILKSSTIFIKDEKKRAIGCICINYDISEMEMLKNTLTEICGTEADNTQVVDETFADDVNSVLANIVSSTLDSFGRPVNYMTKEDKVNVVKILDSKGVFLIKGSVDYVAKVLCVSRYTIYNYLDEIRVATDQAGGR
ncbi:MAG: helix-turn-helix transcriptional regulator [Thermoanaerobacteraceae bacterium]|nr:helix-turn-helix transcriptional regulator [Thermoanaerobacteraceae bacterium]